MYIVRVELIKQLLQVKHIARSGGRYNALVVIGVVISLPVLKLSVPQHTRLVLALVMQDALLRVWSQLHFRVWS